MDDFYDADPDQSIFPLNPPDQAPGLPDTFFGGDFWIGDSVLGAQITQSDDTMMTGLIEGYETNEDFKTEITGTDLEVDSDVLRLRIGLELMGHVCPALS